MHDFIRLIQAAAQNTYVTAAGVLFRLDTHQSDTANMICVMNTPFLAYILRGADARAVGAPAGVTPL